MLANCDVSRIFFQHNFSLLWDLEHHDHIVWQGKNRELSGDQTGCRQANTFGKIIYHFGTKTESGQNVSKKLRGRKNLKVGM